MPDSFPQKKTLIDKANEKKTEDDRESTARLKFKFQYHKLLVDFFGVIYVAYNTYIITDINSIMKSV